MELGRNLWSYIGPDTILPATSILAAVGGLVLAFWNYLAAAFVKSVRFILRRPAPMSAPGPSSAPAVAGGQD